MQGFGTNAMLSAEKEVEICLLLLQLDAYDILEMDSHMEGG